MREWYKQYPMEKVSRSGSWRQSKRNYKKLQRKENEMILYHGGHRDNLQKIVDSGQYEHGHNDNPWSGESDFGGLCCSNVIEYARQYGEAVIEIEISEDAVEYLQPCPLCPGDADWRPWMEDAHEYVIPDAVQFQARFI